jgi:cation diffusion facilitator CzcD-associated flavoprotein CzcO
VLFPAIQGKPMRRWFIKQLCLRNLRRTVKDPELRRKLTPDYPVGAKRVLFGDRYFPALTRDNVTLCTDPIAS